MFLQRKTFWLTALKLFALAFVTGMVLVQIPELRYDFGPGTPVAIESPADLAPGRFSGAKFVAVTGKGDFSHAFTYRRYGLEYTYFNVEPYGMDLVVRTYEPVTDEWKQIDRFVGKLRPFTRQPFSYRIREIYQDQYGLEPTEGAYFLSLYETPSPSGWQIGAIVFAALLWLAMVYAFFLYTPKRPAPQDASQPG